MTSETKIDFRIQSIPHAAVEQDEDDRKRLIRSQMCEVENHLDKEALIADLQNIGTHNPFSVESKKMIHNLGHVECFELCDISSEIQCSYVHKYWTEGVVCCTCRTCLIPAEHTRRLTKERFDTLTFPFSLSKGNTQRCSQPETGAQREYRQARDCSKKASKNGRSSILQRFQQHDTYREPQQAIGWDENTWRRLDKIACEDHSNIATWSERQRCGHN